MTRPVTFLFILFCIVVVLFYITRDTTPELKTRQVVIHQAREVDIDMFIGDWHDSEPRRKFGSLEVRDILTRCDGDPLRPEKKGAVLTDINAVSYGVLEANTATLPSSLDGVQLILYVDSGEGTIATNASTARLSEGIGVLMPPGIEFTMKNTGNSELAMYIIEEPIPDYFIPKQRMIVKNEYDNPISTNIRRVNDSRKWLFDRYDGLSTLVGLNPIMWEPRSYYPPHVHREGEEEIWIEVRGEVLVQLGNKRRMFPAGSAYKVPPDRKTPHTNINTSEVSRKLLWLMKAPVSEVPANTAPRPLQDMI